MDWQLVVVALVVAAASLYLARQSWRAWSGKKAGCGSCSCKPPPGASAAPPAGQVALIPSDQLTLRRPEG